MDNIIAVSRDLDEDCGHLRLFDGLRSDRRPDDSSCWRAYGAGDDLQQLAWEASGLKGLTRQVVPRDGGLA